MARARAVDRRLYLLVEITARRLHRQADARLRREAGVTAAQSAVLFLLSRRGHRRMGAISETLALGAPAVTGLVSRMEAAGLVVRAADSEDRRSAVVSLTEAGRQAAFKADQVLKEINAELADRLGEEQADALQDMLTRLNTGELG
ncbi:MAG: MarR family winged helix-turn-helix transcriptional regulator [Glycocaulis sp.]